MIIYKVLKDLIMLTNSTHDSFTFLNFSELTPRTSSPSVSLSSTCIHPSPCLTSTTHSVSSGAWHREWRWDASIPIICACGAPPGPGGPLPMDTTTTNCWRLGQRQARCSRFLSWVMQKTTSRCVMWGNCWPVPSWGSSPRLTRWKPRTFRRVTLGVSQDSTSLRSILQKLML